MHHSDFRVFHCKFPLKRAQHMGDRCCDGKTCDEVLSVWSRLGVGFHQYFRF